MTAGCGKMGTAVVSGPKTQKAVVSGSVRPRFARPNDNTVISVLVGPGPK